MNKQELKRTLMSAWNSPTLTTWAASASNLLRLALPLPLLIAMVPTDEVAVWLLIVTLAQVLFLFDLGFGVTTSRFVAYAMTGSRDLERFGLTSSPKATPGEPDWTLVRTIIQVVQHVYAGIAVLAVVIVGTVGTYLLAKPIANVADPAAAWLAWGLMLGGAGAKLAGGAWVANLQGTAHVALVRRWDTFINLLVTVLLVAVIAAAAGLPWLGAAVAVGFIIHPIGAWMLSRRIVPLRVGQGAPGPSRRILATVWSRSWRSGMGVLLNMGVVRMTGPLLAQLAAPATVAAYLLVATVLDGIAQLSRAPFYSRIPILAREFAAHRLDAVRHLARGGALLSIGFYATVASAASVAVWAFLRLAPGETPFLGFAFWFAMAAPLLIHMVGAMYLQLYTLTNHVIWHIADGTAGVIYLGVLAGAYGAIGIWAVPLAMILAYGGFYTLFARSRYLKIFATDFLARPASAKAATPYPFDRTCAGGDDTRIQ